MNGNESASVAAERIVFLLGAILLAALPGCTQDTKYPAFTPVDDGPIEVVAAGGGEVKEAVTEPNPVTRNWAILTSMEIRKRGLSDLLGAELAGRPGFKLVEREQIDKIFREQSLAALLGADSVRKRLQLGGLLGADRLLIVDGDLKRVRDKWASIRVVIVDTRVGADLFSAELPCQPNAMDQVVPQLVSIAERVQRQFAEGVRAVVGIPYFVSNTVHGDYDYCQKSYADLLRLSLADGNGIAVVSIDQAQQIRWEIDLIGGDVGGLASLFVFGQFRVGECAHDEVPEMKLSVSIRGGGKELERLEYKNLRLDQAPATLVGPVTATIVRLSGSAQYRPMGLREQAALFGRRADELRTVHSLGEAIDLRESILLLDPDNADQRFSLVRDYLSFHPELDSQPDIEPLARAITHADYLLRHRLVSLQKGLFLVRALGSNQRSRFVDRIVPGEKYYPPKVTNQHLRVAPLLPLLVRLRPEETGKPAPAAQSRISRQLRVDRNVAGPYSQLAAYLFREFVEAGAGATSSPFSPGALDELADVLLDAPDELLENLERSNLALGGYHDPEQVAEFHERLERSDRKVVRQIAAKLRNHIGRNAPPEHLREAIAAWEKARAEEEKKNPKMSSKRHSPIENPFPCVEPDIAADTEFSLVRIHDWRYPRRFLRSWPETRISQYYTTGLISPNSPLARVRIEKLNDATDIAWDRENVFVVTKNADGVPEFRSIFTCTNAEKDIESDAVLRVRCDAEHIWMVTGKGGVSLYSPEGTRLAGARVEEGLPEYVTAAERYLFREGAVQTSLGEFWHEFGPRKAQGKFSQYQLSLFPLGDGQCLAYGRYGKTHATWIAKLSWDGSSELLKVDNLHLANHDLPPLREKPLDAISPTESFDWAHDIPWVCLWRNPQDVDDRVAIVGRVCSWERLDYPINAPLAVDLATNKVTLLGERIPGLAGVTGARAAASVNGSLVILDNEGIKGFVRDTEGRFTEERLVTTRQNRFLINLGDAVYSPGERWYRIELGKGVKVVDLGGATLPPQKELNRFSVSAHYGLWAAWDGDQAAFRVDLNTPCKRVLSPFERYVPEDQLERHLTAVDAIRKLGGHVGRTRWRELSGIDSAGAGFGSPETMVCLTETWRGGDEGLRHLKDLHGVGVVWLLRCPVTNQGVKTLSDIETLGELYLVETRVTTEGFRGFDFNRFRRLRLEGNEGKQEFGDETLRLLEESERLETLCLYGAGFTEKSVDSLKKMPKLRYLRLLDTQIPAGVGALLEVPGRYSRQETSEGTKRVYNPGRYVDVKMD